MLVISNDVVEQGVINSMLGDFYLQYYNKDRWKINQRTQLADFVPALTPIIKHHLRRIGQKVGMQGTQICLICRLLQHLRTQPKDRREGVGIHHRLYRKQLEIIYQHYKRIKSLKDTTVCESMHGGVRGRGSNPPNYSITNN